MRNATRKLILPLLASMLSILVTPAGWSATLKVLDPNGNEAATRLVREYRGGTWTLPNCRLEFTQGVIRTSGNHFILKLELLEGVLFGSAVDPLLITPAGSSWIALQHAQSSGDYVEWLVYVNSSFTDFPTFSIEFGGVSLQLGSKIRSGEQARVRVSAREAVSGNALESPLTGILLEAGTGVSLLGFLPGSARIDVAQGRRFFVEPLVLTDISGKFGVAMSAAVYRHTGEPMAGAAAVSDKLQLTVAGNLTRISDFTIGSSLVRAVTPEERAGTSVSFSLTYANLLSILNSPIEFGIDLNTAVPAVPIDPRTLSLSVLYDYGDSSYDDVPLLTDVGLTTWTLNGTLLTANWVNGNNGSLDSWLFLKNETSMKGLVQIEVFSLPRVGTPSASIGILDLGLIQENAVMRLNIGEHILKPLGIPLPYIENGGNLALEVVLGVPDASGTVQVFRDRNVSFGTYPMNKIANAETGIYYMPATGPWY